MKLSSITIFSLLIIISYSCNKRITKNKNDKIDENNILDKLRAHYKPENNFNKFRLDYTETFTIVTQSYDFRDPKPMHASVTYEVDHDNQYYYGWDKTVFPGNFIFEFAYFQNDTLATIYDVNGVILGKRVRKRDRSVYEAITDDTNHFIEFLAVRELLNQESKKIEISINQDRPIANVQQVSKEDTILYTFNLNPIQLLVIEDKSSNKKWEYQNRKNINGYAIASDIKYYRDSELRNTFKISNLTKINKIDDHKLKIPPGYGPFIDQSEKPLKTEKIAKNLYLIADVAGDRNVLFKVNNEGIIVFGAPISEKNSDEVISLINKEFPDKKINYVFVTHPHSDHVRGLLGYAKKGITILVDEYTALGIKNYPGFKKNIDKFSFRTFKHKETIDDIQFFIPKNSHCFAQSFAYFKNEEIIYEGDLLEIPFDNTIATHISNAEKEFVEFVRAEKLNIKRIVGHHRNNNISVETMNKYYEANTQ